MSYSALAIASSYEPPPCRLGDGRATVRLTSTAHDLVVERRVAHRDEALDAAEDRAEERAAAGLAERVAAEPRRPTTVILRTTCADDERGRRAHAVPRDVHHAHVGVAS